MKNLNKNELTYTRTAKIRRTVYQVLFDCFLFEVHFLNFHFCRLKQRLTVFAINYLEISTVCSQGRTRVFLVGGPSRPGREDAEGSITSSRREFGAVPSKKSELFTFKRAYKFVFGANTIAPIQRNQAES